MGLLFAFVSLSRIHASGSRSECALSELGLEDLEAGRDAALDDAVAARRRAAARRVALVDRRARLDDLPNQKVIDHDKTVLVRKDVELARRFQRDLGGQGRDLIFCQADALVTRRADTSTGSADRQNALAQIILANRSVKCPHLEPFKVILDRIRLIYICIGGN